MLKNMRIGTKIVVLVIAVVVLMSLILGIINYRLSANSLVNMLDETLVEMSSTGAKVVLEGLEKHEAVIAQIANRNVIKSMDWLTQLAAMKEELDRTEFESMAVVTPDFVARTADGKTVDLRGRDYIEKALQGETCISDILVSKLDGTTIFMVASPIRGINGNIVGVLLGQLPGTFLTDITDELAYGEKGYSYIINKDGTFISHNNRDLILNQVNYIEESKSNKEFAELAVLLQAMTKGETGFGSYKYQGEVRYMGYTPIGVNGWSMALGSYESEVLAPVHKMLVSIIVTCVILALLFSFVAVFISLSISKQIKNVNTQIQDIIDAVVHGRLDQRADVAATAIDFQGSVGGINQLIDAFVAPINLTAEYVDRISKGDMPPKITDTYYGDFNEIKNNLNNCIDVIDGLLKTTKDITESVRLGRLDSRANADRYQNAWHDLLGGVNDLINAFVAPINVTAEYVDRISKGDMPPKITDTYHGDFNEIKNNLNACIDSINGMLNESRGVIDAVQAGDVNKRATETGFQGRWQQMMVGFNEIMQAFTTPIKESIERFERIGKGEIPEPIKTDYKGDFNRIKDSVNAAIAGLQGLVEANGVLQKMARNDYTNKVNGEYKGIYSQVGAAVNHVIERLERVQNIAERIGSGDLSDLEGLKKTGKRCENDRLNPALIAMIEAIGLLLADARDLANSAREGNLKARADATRHAGAYRDLIAGVNDLLNAVVTPLTEAMNVMEKLATKQMTARMTGVYKGDLNEFKQNINNAADNLDEALTQVDLAVEQISSAAGQISTGSQTLAESTSEQASSLEEVASSLEEMHSLTVGNADNARQGATLSQQALASVQKGNEAMGRMNEAMASISQSAEQTGKIIKTIDEIAFQTNLLALNAAVEAAHAGEAGKGFAVVAEEVKNLALRSAEAAKNTNELIEGSLKNSEAGTKIVHQVTESFGEIRTSFEKVNSIVNEISAASDEQAEGIGQVNTAINEMNQLTQRNAANAEESASAAEELNSQASELGSMVREFTLSQAHGRGKGRGGRVEDRRRPQKALPGKSAAMYEVSPDKVLPLDDVEEGDFKDF